MDLTSEEVGSYCVAEIMGTELYTLPRHAARQ